VNDLDLLSSSPLLDAARVLIDEMPAVAVDRLASLLALEGARILVVGTGYKPGSSDQTASPAHGIVRELRGRGAIPWFVDSRNDAFIVDETGVPAARPDALGRFDAVIIVSGDDAIPTEALRRAAPVVLDAGGGAGWATRL
jgi:UDP-N-acetyl-D-mannosaminuronate dehydrogenase